MKPLGKQSIRSAVSEIYNAMPRFHKFSMISLHAMVAIRINRPYVFMDSIRRKLGELREEGLINYKNIDKAKSIYKKL